jgi:hypothetical protein
VLRHHEGRGLVVEAVDLGALVDLVYGAVSAVGRSDELRCRENLRGGELEACHGVRYRKKSE